MISNHFALCFASLRLLALAAIVALPISRPAGAQTPPLTPAPMYVNAAAPPGGDGSSWAGAYNSLDTAILNQLPTGELWVAQGSYKPVNQTTGFLITKQLKLYGGFFGNETSVQTRHGSFSRTILEGNAGTPANNSDDVFHVVNIQQVTASSGNPGVVIDGFTIQHGRANSITGPPNPNPIGGGIWAVGSDLDLANCFVSSNSAVSGGGLYFGGGSGSPVLFYTNLHIKTCQFTDNTSGPVGLGGMGDGAGIFGERVNGEVVNTTFRENFTTPQGGGVFLWKMTSEVRLDFTNCVFLGNGATGLTSVGGGVYLGEANALDYANARFVNCTFASNFHGASTGGEAVIVSAHSQCVIYNSIFWGNGFNSPPVPIVGNATVQYSDVEDPSWLSFPGNIWADPRFRNLGTGNLRLTYAPSASPPVISPCLDAADYGRLPPDNLDVNGDGNVTQIIPIDLDAGNRLVNLPVSDSGAGTSPWLDMGSYEHP